MTEPPDGRDSWPQMAESEWDEDGGSVAGTSPTSIVHIGGWKSHNEPVPFVESAACAYCNRWAVDFYVGIHETADGTFSKAILRRMELTLIYACDQHLEDASNELLETYGSCSSVLSDRLELVLKVEAKNRNP